MDLIASDRSQVGVAFFSMSEENLRKALVRRWVAGDTLKLGFDRNAPTYRVTRTARPSSHMNNQF